ncbi:MAG: hypothetical protein FWF23_06235 [Alphaproteobacteria bacterium]|nr:hypothetical protein [Alphaproteobacteria bacterium]MCL2505794.1 hypothetical protein [Alphaproteobacteria bacterium]
MSIKCEIIKTKNEITETIKDVAMEYPLLAGTAIAAGLVIGTNPAAVADIASNIASNIISGFMENTYTMAKVAVCGAVLITPPALGSAADITAPSFTRESFPTRLVVGGIIGSLGLVAVSKLMP